jgi:AraC-like DNA-binding protein
MFMFSLFVAMNPEDWMVSAGPRLVLPKASRTLPDPSRFDLRSRRRRVGARRSAVLGALKEAVDRYAAPRCNADGLVATPVPGVGMLRLQAPSGTMRSVYKPMVCLILQGAKRMSVGEQGREQVFRAGESVIVSADVPVRGTVVQASARQPYLALAIDLNVGLMRELGAAMRGGAPAAAQGAPLFVQDIDASVTDCGLRLVRLLDSPQAIGILQAGIVRELHYWLLNGRHGAVLSELALPDSNASRLAASVEILRCEFRSRIPVRRLAEAAAMSLTSFHVGFKQLTSLTPLQFQKQLRLIEGRRLMTQEGMSATQAAFEVGYESVSQFSREYARMFGAPPRRDALALLQAGEAPRGRGLARR